MKSVLPVALLFIILGVGAYVEGTISDRWGRSYSHRLKTFSSRLKLVPKEFGGWVGVDHEINEKEFKQSNCDACVSRTYTNREGQQVNIYLVSGSARHVTIHTPDWCYVGAGYDQIEDPNQYSIDNCGDLETDPQFLTSFFRKEEPLRKHELRIFWSFSDDGTWLGPRIAKTHFSGRPAMFKLYMITDVAQDGVAIETNPSLAFAREFLPIINKILFAPEEETSEST